MKQLDIKDLKKVSGGIGEGGCIPRISLPFFRIWF